MYSIKHIKNTKYFAMSIGDEEPWLVKPCPGYYVPFRRGVSPNGIAWFFDPKVGLYIYDVKQRVLKSRLTLPFATDPCPTRTSKNAAANYTHSNYQVLASLDGAYLYHITRHGIMNNDLSIVSLKTGKIVKTITDLPGGGSLANNCLLDERGRILYSASIKSENYHSGMVRIDPMNGKIETAICTDSPASGWLHSPSFNARYWLRAENNQIPHVSIKPKGKLFGSGASQGPTKDFFSFAIEIWEAFPLRRIAVVAPLWFSSYGLPDEGGLDTQKNGKLGDSNIWMDSEAPLKRTKIFRDISAYLKENPNNGRGDILNNREGVTDWLWPEKKSRFANIQNNFDKLMFKNNDFIGWQGDSQAFWINRNGFVSCVGINGEVSPSTLFERYGMQTGTWLPCAARFKKANPLHERRLEVHFENEIVIADGRPEAPTIATRAIPLELDELTEINFASVEADARLVEKADAKAKKLSVYRIDLRSLEEADCVAAIDALTAQIGPDINERPYDNQLTAVFVLGRKKLNEMEFFSHVGQSFPSSASALARLLEAVCNNTTSLDGAYYDPYEDKAGMSVAAFGFAAFCLAKLDANSNPVLLKYGALIDTYHEHFYLHNIFQIMIENESDHLTKLSMAENVLLGNLGNCFSPSEFWKFANMTEIASDLFSPIEYAQRLLKRDQEINTGDLNVRLTGPILNQLTCGFEKNSSDWEISFLNEIGSKN